jgi:hypothetical protein
VQLHLEVIVVAVKIDPEVIVVEVGIDHVSHEYVLALVADYAIRRR